MFIVIILPSDSSGNHLAVVFTALKLSQDADCRNASKPDKRTGLQILHFWSKCQHVLSWTQGRDFPLVCTWITFTFQFLSTMLLLVLVMVEVEQGYGKYRDLKEQKQKVKMKKTLCKNQFLFFKQYRGTEIESKGIIFVHHSGNTFNHAS